MSSRKSQERTAIGKLGSAIGKGLIAGLAGTIAMSVSQAIERRINKGSVDLTAAKAVEKLFDIGPEPGTEEILAQEVHYVYGTLWGSARGILSLCGLRGFEATASHFAALWSTALAVETGLDLAPPVEERQDRELLMSAVHHLVYAVVAGLVYDAID